MDQSSSPLTLQSSYEASRAADDDDADDADDSPPEIVGHDDFESAPPSPPSASLHPPPESSSSPRDRETSLDHPSLGELPQESAPEIQIGFCQTLEDFEVRQSPKGMLARHHIPRPHTC